MVSLPPQLEIGSEGQGAKLEHPVCTHLIVNMDSTSNFYTGAIYIVLFLKLVFVPVLISVSTIIMTLSLPQLDPPLQHPRSALSPPALHLP